MPPTTSAMLRTVAALPIYSVPPCSQSQCLIDRKTPSEITPTTEMPTQNPSDFAAPNSIFLPRRTVERAPARPRDTRVKAS